MNEASFQAARKVMQRANYIRGQITTAKGNVAKWTKIEHSHRENLREAQAEGAKKMLDKHLKILKEKRDLFAKLTFPDINLKAEDNRCNLCGKKIKIDESCMCIYQ